MPNKLYTVYIALLRASIVNSVMKLQLILFIYLNSIFHKDDVSWCHVMSRVITWALNVKRIPKSKGFDVSYRWLSEQHELNIF